MKYSPNVQKRVVRAQWKEDCLWIEWGKHVFGYTKWAIDKTIKNAMLVDHHHHVYEEGVGKFAKEWILRCLGPSTKLNIEIDYESFADAEGDCSVPLNNLHVSEGKYTIVPVLSALHDISAYESDEMCDFVSSRVRLIVISLQPGFDSSKKSMSSKTLDVRDDEGGELIEIDARLCLEVDEGLGCFDANEWKSQLCIHGLPETVKFRVPILSGLCLSWNVHWWGSLSEVCKLLTSDLSHPMDPSLRDVCSKRKLNGTIVKAWGPVMKKNQRGKLQPRYFLLTTETVSTFQMKKSYKIKDSTFKTRRLDDIAAIDVYPFRDARYGSQVMTAMSIFFKDDDEKEKPEIHSSVKSTLLIRGSLKGSPLRWTDLPHIDHLPPVSVMPFDSEKSSSDRPSSFIRFKKPGYSRIHPVTNCMYNMNLFLPPIEEDDDEKDSGMWISTMEEIAWCVFAAASARTRSTTLEPFYLSERNVYTEPTQVYTTPMTRFHYGV
eukprot:TRINITY_DN3024_c0_g1_i5.p1 TRINITY_DN3024_c0_g1~~TRINITY_DN3024_c0_g1_i5.p1  ORF type:complete len:490 (-),score=103.94 TRINITY_DN3024_c0_g1_i5:197-1666(-)